MGSSVPFDYREVNPLDVFEAVDSFAKHEERRFIVAIDEAQCLRYGKKISTLLAYVVDRLELVTTILTGSEVGLLYDFIGLRILNPHFMGELLKP